MKSGLKQGQAKIISHRFRLPLCLARLLVDRGLTDETEVECFLEPRLSHLPDPFSIKGMADAVTLIIQALNNNQHVAVHGDYDVDGITSTVLLVDFLKKIGLQVVYYIPNRLREGYGLSRQSVDKLAQQVSLPALLITVDCGISSYKEIQYANELGFKVIVTDHHLPSKQLPPAVVTLNPQQADCSFTYKSLSGAGVAFYLLIALRNKLIQTSFWTQETAPNLKEYLDLVALGTVADVVPLTGVNRILVRAGLEVLSCRKRPGIRALSESAGLKMESRITADDIGFRFGPRLNATGRLGMPELSAELLLSRSEKGARATVRLVEQANIERKAIEKESLIEAVKQAEKQINNGANGLVLYKDDWHPGIIGILASRIVDQFERPTIILTRDNNKTDGHAKGSGRSIPGIDIFNALSTTDALLEQFGGHAMAAGLTIKIDNLSEFKEFFNKYAGRTMLDLCTESQNKNGIVLNFSEDCLQLARHLHRLEPFGEANPEPVFLVQGVKLEKVTLLREHLKYSIRFQGKPISGIGFFMADKYSMAKNEPINIGMKIKQSTFRGRVRVESHAVYIEPTC